MNNPKISIVLPIYNVEPYLERCLQSVEEQSYANLEIILVDDGSPDNCPSICERWATKDSRIIVVHKQNAGLGMARNTGIEHATGDYICFFDSDDYIARDAIEQLVRIIEEHNVEIVTYGYANINRLGECYDMRIPKCRTSVFTGHEIEKEFLPDLIAPMKTSMNKGLHMSAWASIYSMELIHRTGWRFASEREIIAEDVYSLLYLYKHVRKVAVLEKALYFYCDNAGSLTHTYRPDRFEKICSFHRACVTKCQELDFGENVIVRFQEPMMSFTIAAMKMILNSQLNKREKMKEIKKIIHSPYVENLCWTRGMEASITRKFFTFCFRNKMSKVCFWILALK